MSAAKGKDVLVLGTEPRSFLAVVRSLGRQGLRVHVGWHPTKPWALRSRYIHRVHYLPQPRPGEDAWKDALGRLLDSISYDLVIPCDDRVIFPLHRVRASIEDKARLALVESRLFDEVNDKARLCRRAAGLGIPVPRERPVSAEDTAGGLLEEFGTPFILKPLSSYSMRDWARKCEVRKVFRASDMPKAVEDGAFVAQENIRGIGVGVDFLADRGKLLYAFAHERVHEPPLGGGSSYRRSVPLPPDLLDAAEKLVCDLGYTGVGMLEFKVDLATGAWRLLELNPRFWGSLPLAVAAGANFPYYLYRLLVEGQTEFPPGYRTGMYARNLIADIGWMKKNHQADRRDPALCTKTWPTVLAEARHLLTGHERWDMLTVDDPRPGLAEIRMSWIRRCEKARIRRIEHSVRRRRIERDKSSECMARRAGIILFVCKGNICRSPFAEALARRLSPSGTEIVSAGYFPEEGRVSPALANSMAATFGVDLQKHTSRMVTRDLAAHSKIIFVFDEDNMSAMKMQFPEAKRKLFYLGIWQEGAVGMVDPVDAPERVYHDVYHKIEDSLRTLSRQVLGLRKDTI
ncbi:MAG: hypothetical protein EOM20_01900 [Spartobacteria bacterium]|nr:hypothetical protein [Spartobacteria bacterium]